MPRGSQENTAGTTLKDRSSTGPRPDGGGGAGEVGDIGGTIPIGGIIMYSGAFADIPTNWALCDGTGGTPDLTDRFVLGTVTEGELEDTGGTADHRHTIATADVAGNEAMSNTAGGTNAAATQTGSIGNNSAAVTGATDAHTTTTLVATVGVGVTVLTGPAAHSITGTAASHNHTFTGDAHTHVFTGTAHNHALAGKTGVPATAGGDTDALDVIPPWLKLAFIQRIS